MNLKVFFNLADVIIFHSDAVRKTDLEKAQLAIIDAGIKESIERPFEILESEYGKHTRYKRRLKSAIETVTLGGGELYYLIWFYL